MRFLLLGLLLAATSASAVDGTLIVLNKSEANLSLIDLASGAVTATLPTGQGPHEAAVSPDRALCVVADYGTREQPGNTLHVYDLAEPKIGRVIELGEHRRPHGIVFTAARQVAVTTEDSAHLCLVDVEKGELVAAIPTHARVSHMVVVHPELQRAFLANIGSGSVSVLDLAKREFVTELKTGAGAEAIDLSPDGEHVLVSNAQSGDVAVFDAAARKEIARVSMQAGAVAEKDERLFGDRFGDSPVPVGILVHPDGTRAYVANTNADVISVIDLGAWKLVDRLVAGKEPDGMAFVPARGE